MQTWLEIVGFWGNWFSEATISVFKLRVAMLSPSHMAGRQNQKTVLGRSIPGHFSVKKK